MGHYSVKVTVNIYGKLVPGANKAAVDRLDAVEDAVRKAQPSATPAQPTSRKAESAEPGRPGTPRIQMVELRGAVLDGVRVETLVLPMPRWAQGPR